jgi:hypothetical protein
VNERKELRSVSGHLVGVLLDRGIIEIKRGRRVFTLDMQTLGAPVIFERVLRPAEATAGDKEGSTREPA